MKARVKATGDIIEVIRETQHIHFDYYDGKMLYKAEALEFIDDDNPDYWTRLEHQYAGMAMQAYIIASHISQFSFCESDMKDCKIMSHALVEKMKEERK